MMKQYIYFKEMPINTLFSLNGNRCKKQSSRTAKLLDFGIWFYFGMYELCIVNQHDRLDKNYWEIKP